MKKQNLILTICLVTFLSFAYVVGCGNCYDQPAPPPSEGHAGNVTDFPSCRLIERFGCQYVWCWDTGYKKGMGGLVAADPSCRPSATLERR